MSPAHFCVERRITQGKNNQNSSSRSQSLAIATMEPNITPATDPMTTSFQLNAKPWVRSVNKKAPSVRINVATKYAVRSERRHRRRPNYTFSERRLRTSIAVNAFSRTDRRLRVLYNRLARSSRLPFCVHLPFDKKLAEQDNRIRGAGFKRKLTRRVV